MVRSRIGSRPAFADTDTLSGTDRWAVPSRVAPTDIPPTEHEAAAEHALAEHALAEHALAEHAPAQHAAVEHAPEAKEAAEPGERFGHPFAFILEIVGKAARSIGLGCLIALGGCGPGQRVELEGVVRDGRTGDPVAGAQITTEDGRTLETDDEGRFVVTAGDGEHLHVTAVGRCDAQARAERQPIAIHLFDRMELSARATELDAEVRLEVRTPCDEAASVRWQQIAGPALRPEAMRVEEDGRVLVVRTHARVMLEAVGELGGSVVSRTVRVPGLAVGGADGGLTEQHVETPSRREAALHAEWQRSGMSRASELASRAECASCHGTSGFLAWHHGRVAPNDGVSAITCGACHDPLDRATPRGLRVYDRVADIGGAPAEHLGSGAVCASCHRSARDADAIDVAAHAPQADVLLGRGARLAAPLDDGAHRFIVDTCVRCHMTRAEGAPLARAGGHTFIVQREGEAACAPCHGRVSPDRIGMRDWSGDGTVGSVRDEHRGALARARELLGARVGALELRDACSPARLAATVVPREARLHLADGAGVLLGDCDGSGSIDAGEAAVTTAALPRHLADAAHDLALLENDRSAGLHNPAYAFRVLDAALRALQ